MLVEVKRGGHVQRMTYEELEQRIIEGDIRERTPVRFELVTGDRFVPAGELELYQTLADPGRMAFRRNLSRRGIPLVTAILVGVQLRLYLLSFEPETEGWLQRELTNWAPAILEGGEVWRLLSYGLLHTWLPHLLFNMLFLVYTGYHLERAVGRANLLLIFFGSSMSGGLLSMAMSMDRPSLGASGGVFGMLAAGVVVGWKYWEVIPEISRRYFGGALAWYIGYSLLSGLRSEGTDNWSHLGGMIGGGVIMTVLQPEVIAARTNRRVRALIVMILGGGTLALALTGPSLVPLSEASQDGWSLGRPSYWKEGWTFTGDRGWFSPMLDANLSAATTVHPRPIRADEAARSLVDRIQSGGREAELLSQEAFELDGWTAQRLELSFTLSGEPQHLVALVLARGIYEHRIQFQVLQPQARRRQPLADRVLGSVRLDDPPDLVEAQERAQMHPRSYEPALGLAEAYYRAGLPEKALAEFRRAGAYAPEQGRPVKGVLLVHAHYQIPGGAALARQAIVEHPLDPEVLVAAVAALEAESATDEARRALDEAWVRLPGDRALRRARQQRGMTVELP